jgi:tripartite-type tricarboxylate transporter receptor subunit TctC
VSKLAAAVMAYTKLPEAMARAIKDGYELEGSTPQALGRFIDSEVARWTKVVSDNGIKLND